MFNSSNFNILFHILKGFPFKACVESSWLTAYIIRNTFCQIKKEPYFNYEYALGHFSISVDKALRIRLRFKFF